MGQKKNNKNRRLGLTSTQSDMPVQWNEMRLAINCDEDERWRRLSRLLRVRFHLSNKYKDAHGADFDCWLACRVDSRSHDSSRFFLSIWLSSATARSRSTVTIKSDPVCITIRAGCHSLPTGAGWCWTVTYHSQLLRQRNWNNRQISGSNREWFRSKTSKCQISGFFSSAVKKNKFVTTWSTFVVVSLKSYLIT